MLSININQNTSPISPFTADHHRRAMDSTSVSQYPLGELERFKANYSRITGLPADEIELANGSDEWIQKLMIVFGLDGGVLTLDPDFFMYKDYAEQLGVDLQTVAANEYFEFDIDEVIARIHELKPKMFIFSNPHNPIGTQFLAEDVQRLADAMQAVEGYLVIDEAYIEFGEEYARPTGDHVVVIRTMSKIYGMAGMRIGIMHATGPTYAKITKINHPYPLNSLVLNTASEFLEDTDALETFIAYQREVKELLVEALDPVSDVISVTPSSTNFIFTYGDQAVSLGRHLESKGYEARFYEEENLQNVVRYSILALEFYPEFKEAILEWKASLS